jgi:hypothetical protein
LSHWSLTITIFTFIFGIRWRRLRSLVDWGHLPMVAAVVVVEVEVVFDRVVGAEPHRRYHGWLVAKSLAGRLGRGHRG